MLGVLGEEEATKAPRRRLQSLFHSVVFWSRLRPKKEKVTLPDTATYVPQIQQCEEMYERLHLDKRLDDSSIQHSLPFPLLRGHTMVNQSRPLTYSVHKYVKASRPFSIRSAPAFMFQKELTFDQDVIHIGELHEDHAKSESTDFDCDEHGRERKRNRMDPETLCEYLKERGLGLPSVVQSTSTYRRVTQAPPRGMRSRSLPRNPSQREKIKGRARLDQEMANMRALAFCEQQAPKVFRTASANMRNRDVQFMEEDFREHMQKEGGFDLNIYEDNDDDNASIVKMPIKQEELFLRINTWVEEVEHSCKVYMSHQNVPVTEEQL